MMISEFIERTGFEPTASEYAKINFVTLKRDEIVIQVTPKAYSTK